MKEQEVRSGEVMEATEKVNNKLTVACADEISGRSQRIKSERQRSY